MKKGWMHAGLGLLALLLMAGPAFGWGSATHAWLDDRIGLARQPANLNEVYGGMATDTFETLFDQPAHYVLLSTAVHSNSDALWDGVKNQPERELAFGFASHSEVWGADSTAHRDGRTFGQGEGYVIAKARQLQAELTAIPAFAALDLPEETTLLVAHIVLEFGIDQLVVELDPQIGAKISAAALRRSPFMAQLLVNAYGPLLTDIPESERFAYFAELEKSFRQRMILYGQALQQEPALSQQLVTAMLVDLSKSFLQMFQVTPPDDATLSQLIGYALVRSMELCDSDEGNFRDELVATRTFVAEQLKQHDIVYRSQHRNLDQLSHWSTGVLK